MSSPQPELQSRVADIDELASDINRMVSAFLQTSSRGPPRFGVTPLDHVAARLNDTIVHVSLLHNQSSHINQLPVEILRAIFMHLIPDHLDRSHAPRPNVTMCAVQRVCRWWRAVIFEDPSFWSNIEVRGKLTPSAFQTLIGRRQAPQLRDLCCIGNPLHATNKFQNLTRLFLWMAYPDVPVVSSATLDFLEGSPSLEELALHHTGPHFVEDLHTFADRRVSMPRLKKITLLQSCFENTAQLFRNIVPAQHAVIQVDQNWAHILPHIFLRIFTKDAGFLQNVTNVTDLSVWAGSQLCFKCVSATGSLTFNLELKEKKEKKPVLPDGRRIPHWHHHLSVPFIEMLPRTFNLEHVDTFKIDADVCAGLPSLTVLALFHSMPAVQSCAIRLHSHLPLKSWSKTLSKKSVTFPALASLEYVGTFPETERLKLFDVAIRRARRGSPLRELKLTNIPAQWADLSECTRVDVESVKVGSHRLLDFVDSVQVRAAEESPMAPPMFTHWDGNI
ncbi:uncharacterized protein B0H18DRAFT_1120802 [Fomitopsis serialis]|uniref:uncharacterized protein n=1 Tax=Fomitopsis serialis TaxID=139415 RepID=UPI0020074EB3|nr:uncharacterized protein B0H18DRAFT_1120802 [Neoantrodia serialis]KAH9922627.1 hypothetical protein B0H18DRAFT_1120802 [Neoantrodia serialis]